MRHPLRPVLWLAILTVGLGLALAACNSGTATGTTPGSKADTIPPTLTITSSATASGVTYDLTGKAGDNVGATKITYSVNGGATKTVDLSKPTFDIKITLSPGVNTIDVAVYDAAGNETTKTFTVTYTPPPTTGSLTVEILGLPSGAQGNVAVSGPTAVQPVTATFTLTGLAPGTYTVTPSDVTAQDTKGNTYTYGGTVTVNGNTVNTVDVTAGTTQTAKVTYAATTGDVIVTFVNLPSGTSGSLGVSGPTSVPTVTADKTLTGLTPGTYTLTPNAISDGTYAYTGTTTVNGNPASSVGVTAGSVQTVDVSYVVSSGAMAIDFTGTIPSGYSYGATVAGSSPAVSRHPTTSTAGTVTVADLPAQQYTVTPDAMPSSACVGGTKTSYPGTVTPTNPQSVSTGQTANVTVTYTAVQGVPCP